MSSQSPSAETASMPVVAPHPADAAPTVVLPELGFPLLPSDPRHLGSLDIVRRLKPQLPIADAVRPVPFLALGQRLAADREPAEFVVKVVTAPPSEVAKACLDAEELWAAAAKTRPSRNANREYAWVARDFVRGEPLDALFGVMTEEDKALYAERLLMTIAAMHANGGAHLDIKPSNVIVTPDGEIRLIDYESARRVDQRSSAASLATPSYASPEQLIPRSERPVGTASDLFSWGLTVCAMYGGGHPYGDAGVYSEQRIRELDRGPTPMPVVPESVPQPLRGALLRALAWLPADRPSAPDLLTHAQQRDPGTVLLQSATLTQVLSRAATRKPPAIASSFRRALAWFGPDGPLGDKVLTFEARAAGWLAGFVLALVLTLILVVLLRMWFR